MLSAKNVVKPGYSVFIRQTTSADVVWLLTTLSHSLYIDNVCISDIKVNVTSPEHLITSRYETILTP